MILSEEQRDALSEVINLGFGRSANALSILVTKRVILQAPEANVFPISELGQAFDIFHGKLITTVHQSFGGGISGDLALLIDTPSATALVDMVHKGEATARPQLSEEDANDLKEIGNILLNAFCGSFGNFLNVSITFSIPRLTQQPIEKLLEALTNNQPEIKYAVVVKVHFELTEGSVDGYVMILMGLASLEVLFTSMKSEGYYSGDTNLKV